MIDSIKGLKSMFDYIEGNSFTNFTAGFGGILDIFPDSSYREVVELEETSEMATIDLMGLMDKALLETLSSEIEEKGLTVKELLKEYMLDGK